MFSPLPVRSCFHLSSALPSSRCFDRLAARRIRPGYRLWLVWVIASRPSITRSFADGVQRFVVLRTVNGPHTGDRRGIESPPPRILRYLFPPPRRSGTDVDPSDPFSSRIPRIIPFLRFLTSTIGADDAWERHSRLLGAQLSLWRYLGAGRRRQHPPQNADPVHTTIASRFSSCPDYC